MNLGDRVRIAGREYVVGDEAFLSADPSEYRSLSWREVDVFRLAADGERWCAICGRFVSGGGHDPEAHGENEERRVRAEQKEAQTEPEACESCGKEQPLVSGGMCSDCAAEFARDDRTDYEIERMLEDRHGFVVSASVNAAGRWEWEVRAGEVIVASGAEGTRAAALASARTATNWTLDGTPIRDGFDVVGAGDEPDADPCYYCGRRTATSDADPYNGGDGGRICAACVDEHDSILRTASMGLEDLYAENGKPAGADGRELSRGTKVVVTEENIRPWAGEVGSTKWSPKSGWIADVRRDDDGLTYSVPVGMIRTAFGRTAGNDLVTGGPANDWCLNHDAPCGLWAVTAEYWDLVPAIDEAGGEAYYDAGELRRIMTPERCIRAADWGGPCYFVREGRPSTASRRGGLRTAMPSPADLGVKVGDIFYCSWGYDQTNVNWYEVVRLTGQGVEVQAIRSEIVGSSGMGSDSVVPVPGSPLGREDVLIRGERKVCRLKDWGGSAGIVLGDYTAILWDGKPKHETSSGYGH